MAISLSSIASFREPTHPRNERMALQIAELHNARFKPDAKPLAFPDLKHVAILY